MKEEILTGGTINTVSRKGDVVFRSGGQWVPAVHKVLTHLQKNKFPYSPKPLGLALDGREMVSYLNGKTIPKPWPKHMFENDSIVQVSKMLRMLHNITQDLVFPKDTIWRFATSAKTKKQIIRHGDLSPWNTLWEGDKLVGLIDWDFAEPGDAITDLAQLAAYFVPFIGGGSWEEVGFNKEPNYKERLALIIKSYDKDYTEKDVVLALDKLHILEMSRLVRFSKKKIHPWEEWSKNGEYSKMKEEQNWLHNKFPEYFQG
ncbi:MAG: phosphotransferase [Candidatus Saccharibacteria bacterium]